MYTERTYCKGCGRMLKFVRTERGAWMPCESFPVRAVPDEKGILLYREDGTSFKGRLVDKMCTSAELCFEPHFGRCSHPVPRPGEKKTKPDPAQEAERIAQARKRAEEEKRRVIQRELERREREWKERQCTMFGE